LPFGRLEHRLYSGFWLQTSGDGDQIQCHLPVSTSILYRVIQSWIQGRKWDRKGEYVPPRRPAATRAPTRAIPVPFCCRIFLVLPLTSPLVFVCPPVPLAAFASYTTARCKISLLIGACKKLDGKGHICFGLMDGNSCRVRYVVGEEIGSAAISCWNASNRGRKYLAKSS